MAVENVNNGLEFSAMNNSSTKKQTNNMLVIQAEALGINVGAYYLYDTDNNCIGINLQELSMAIKEANMKSESATSANNNDSDSFVKSEDGTTKGSKDETTEASTAKDEIDSNYKDAFLKYSESINDFENNASEEGQLAAQWNSIEAEENKLTSVLASDTTIIEGVKEFISNLTNLVNDTKNYEKAKEENDKKETLISLKNARDIQDEQNEIEVYETETYENTLGNNPFFVSAFETSEYDEKAVV